MYTPTDITTDIDTGVQTASFNYYDGIGYAKEHNLERTMEFSLVNKGTHFIVCCGDVMVNVTSSDFTHITRRAI